MQLAVLVYLPDGITDALQMQRELENELSHDLLISRVLFVLPTIRYWLCDQSLRLAA